MLLENQNVWTMASYVDKSHFKLIKVIGIGTHSIIWLVEKRTSSLKSLPNDFDDQMLMDHEKKFKNQGAVKTDVLKDENGNEIRQFFAMKVMDKRKLFKFRSIETVK